MAKLYYSITKKRNVIKSDSAYVDWTDEYPHDPFTIAMRAAARPISLNGKTVHRTNKVGLTLPKALAILKDRRRTASGKTTPTNNKRGTVRTNKKEATMPAVRKAPATRKSAKSTDSVSVEVTMVRFREPSGKGGVRFNAEGDDPAITTVYLAQADDNAMDNPQRLLVTITAA